MRGADSFEKTLMLGKIEGRRRDNRGWDGWMASQSRCTNSGSWWWTGMPGVLRFMGWQRVRHDWLTQLNWTSPVSMDHSPYPGDDSLCCPSLGVLQFLFHWVEGFSSANWLTCFHWWAVPIFVIITLWKSAKIKLQGLWTPLCLWIPGVLYFHSHPHLVFVT